MKKSNSEIVAITLTFWTFLICMSFFAVIRFFGILWFANVTVINDPHIFIKELVFFLLRFYDSMIMYKIATKKSWKFAIVLALLNTTICLLVPLSYKFIVDIVSIMLATVLCNRKGLIKQLKIVIIVLALQFIYSLLFLYARVDVDYLASINWTYSVIGIVDYKLFILVMYLFIRRKEYEKKVQK